MPPARSLSDTIQALGIGQGAERGHGSPMRFRGALPCVAVVALLAPAPALAGAPNWECRFGDDLRIGLDVWHSSALISDDGAPFVRRRMHRTTSHLLVRHEGRDWWFTVGVNSRRAVLRIGDGAPLRTRCLRVIGGTEARLARRAGEIRREPRHDASVVATFGRGAIVWTRGRPHADGWVSAHVPGTGFETPSRFTQDSALAPARPG